MRPITEAEIIASLEAMAAGRWPMPVASMPVEDVVEKPKPVGRDWLHVATKGRNAPSMKVLLQAVSLRTGIPITDIRSPRRSAPIVRARMMFWALCHRLTNASLPQMGRFAGGKDHSTVLHGVRKVNKQPDLFQPELGALMHAFMWERPEA